MLKRLLFAGLLLGMLPAVSALTVKVVPQKNFNLRDQWLHILPNRPPMSSLATAVRTQQPFEINVFVTGPEIDAKGEAALAVRFSVQRPDGREMLPEAKFEKALSGKLASGGVYLLSSYLNVDFEPADAAGKYRVRAVVRELKSGKEVAGEATVEHLKLPPSEKVTLSQAENNSFLMEYYQKPRPEKLLSSFLSFLKTEPEMRKKQGKRFNPLAVLGFYHFVLRANPQLTADFAALSPKLPETHRLYLACVLQHLPGIEKIADPALAGMLRRFSANPYHFSKVSNPVQQDILWSRFFATGGYAPIRMLADSLHSGEDTISLEEFKKIAKPTLDDRKRLFRGVTEIAATWSLTVNARRHPLVFFYLEAMLKRGELKDKAASEKLRKIFEKVQAGMPGRKGK